jgi:hypothetical protein
MQKAAKDEPDPNARRGFKSDNEMGDVDDCDVG